MRQVCQVGNALEQEGTDALGWVTGRACQDGLTLPITTLTGAFDVKVANTMERLGDSGNVCARVTS